MPSVVAPSSQAPPPICTCRVERKSSSCLIAAPDPISLLLSIPSAPRASQAPQTFRLLKSLKPLSGAKRLLASCRRPGPLSLPMATLGTSNMADTRGHEDWDDFELSDLSELSDVSDLFEDARPKSSQFLLNSSQLIPLALPCPPPHPLWSRGHQHISET